jgi:putative flavoprotein involved in K+ transport
MPHHLVIIVGGGQAGLSLSYYLRQAGIDHLVLEKNRIAHAWRDQRWDSFCLVTPNWQCRLPDFPYEGDDPHGFMVKDEIIAYLEAFARKVDPPIREGVTVQGLCRDGNGLHVATSAGDFTADHVVVATGGYDLPIIPADAASLPEDIAQIHSVAYRNPGQLPPGAVLVVGSGQSGVQIMEDLLLAGRPVHLCVGTAPRCPRQYRGKDAVEWLDRMGHYRLTIDDHPQGEQAKHKTNHYLSGRDGGHEIDLRRFARQGVALYGSLKAVKGSVLAFNPDLAANMDGADAVYCRIRDDIDRFIKAQGIDAPVEPPFVPVWHPEREVTELDCRAAKIAAIVWAIGFKPDYSWIRLPGFDGRGEPCHARGVSPAEGLYFLGLPWLHRWGSGRFFGIAEDAQHLAEVIGARLQPRGRSR